MKNIVHVLVQLFMDLGVIFLLSTNDLIEIPCHSIENIFAEYHRIMSKSDAAADMLDTIKLICPSEESQLSIYIYRILHSTFVSVKYLFLVFPIALCQF